MHVFSRLTWVIKTINTVVRFLFWYKKCGKTDVGLRHCWSWRSTEKKSDNRRNYSDYRPRRRNTFQSRLCPLISLRLRVSSDFADVNHSFSSSVALLQLVKGLRNLLKAERLLHHGPDLNQTKTKQLITACKLSSAKSFQTICHNKINHWRTASLSCDAGAVKAHCCTLVVHFQHCTLKEEAAEVKPRPFRFRCPAGDKKLLFFRVKRVQSPLWLPRFIRKQPIRTNRDTASCVSSFEQLFTKTTTEKKKSTLNRVSDR